MPILNNGQEVYGEAAETTKDMVLKVLFLEYAK